MGPHAALKWEWQRGGQQRTPLDPEDGSHAIREGLKQLENNEEQRGKDGMDGMEQRGKDYEMEQDGGPPDGDIGPGVIMKELDIKDTDPGELKQWQQQNPSLVKISEKTEWKSQENGSTFTTRMGRSTRVGSQKAPTLGTYKAVSNWCCPRIVI